MPTYTQEDRPLVVTTPLGKDVLLASGFRGYEAVSELFRFEVDLLAALDREVRFDLILGKPATVALRLRDGKTRHFNGLVQRFSQGSRDDAFVRFRAEIVPALWLLTRKIRSRIFQHLSVPDILREVFAGLDVVYEFRGTYFERDYCVQYRESDFEFASRIMEEEGMYYFFQHGDGTHQMIVSDIPDRRNPPVPGPTPVTFEELSGGEREDVRVTAWEKTQELRSGKYTLRDHCFELPGNPLEAQEAIQESVVVGKVTHKLAVGGNDQLEIYDYPGEYAQRFDGVGKSGEARPQDLSDVFRDKDRVVRIRIEEEEGASLEIAGVSNCAYFVPGHVFALEKHVDAAGQYFLTRVEHDARFEGNYRSDQGAPLTYENRFTCRPVTLPFRPRRVTRRPQIAGVQTATVVGHPGEEILCDKYGRVKVQFHWDREGKRDANSSCWVRVSQLWAGKGWGAFFWPRVGHEVVVAFEEGDPDQPIIVGSVYNAENMPPFDLPRLNLHGGIKSCSLRGTSDDHFNGIVFVDEKGHEHLAIHSERHLSLNTEFDKSFGAGRHKSERVASTALLTVGMLPGGGGSGGGWEKPGPLAVPGLNSVMVFGENLQAAVGINHQFALGSNFQICINPGGLAAGLKGVPAPSIVTGFLGGGLGGNMQFTVGTSASIVLGRAIDINLGPPKMDISGGESTHVMSLLICGLIGGAVLAWVLAYNFLDTDSGRAALTIAFQLLFDLLLAALVMIEVQLKKAEMLKDATDGKVFSAEEWSVKETAQVRYTKVFGDSDPGGFLAFCEGIGLGTAILGAGALPLVAIAAEDRSGFDPKESEDSRK